MRKWKIILISLLLMISVLSLLIFLNLSLLDDKTSEHEKIKSYMTSAKSFKKNKDFELAIKDYIKILDIEPLNDIAYNEIIILSKDYSEYLMNQGKNLDDINKKFDEAEITSILLDNVKRNFKIDSNNTESNGKQVFYLTQAEKYCKKNQPEKAIKLLKNIKGDSFFNEESEKILFKAYINLALSFRYFKTKMFT